MFDRPSINLGRIAGGDALNRVPDECTMAIDIRYLPGQDPEEILSQVRAIPSIEVARTFIWPTVSVSRSNPYVRALRDAVARSAVGEVMSVGRDGASDAAAFIEAGIPAVEFGPAGGGHHGPEEWVSLSSLARYRRSLGDFIRALPMRLEESRGRATPAPAGTVLDEQDRRRAGAAGLKAIEGGLA
jgi:succinyl-diaminopimelate desuccinylase